MNRRRRGLPPSERKVAGSFIAAQTEIRKLLPTDADPLVAALEDIEAAMQQSADTLLTPVIREHCYAALRVINDIESQHGKGNLPESVTDCLNEIRVDVKRALARLDVTSGGLKLLTTTANSAVHSIRASIAGGTAKPLP